MNYYRVEERLTASGSEEYGFSVSVNIYILSYSVSKETSKGVRLENGKLVLHNSKKKWASKTIKLAFESFLARKERHKKILQSKLDIVNQSLNIAKQCQLGEMVNASDLKSAGVILMGSTPIVGTKPL